MKAILRRKFGTVVLAAASMLPSTQALAAQQSGMSTPAPRGSADPTTAMTDQAMMAPMDSMNMKHMVLSPTRSPTHADSVQALALVTKLRDGIVKYQDTSAAVADGYKMFAPNVKNQRVYHFTKGLNAIKEAFRFNPSEPTSLLYQRDPAGKLVLVGAMYTLPRRASAERLDQRVPLSIARWHQHVNWCLPKQGDEARWTERKNGLPVFGPESPIVTREACAEVGGRFAPTLGGWMVHANVFAGDDLGTIFADRH